MVRRDSPTGEVSSAVFASASKLFENIADYKVMAIDIPIGLKNSEPRACDVQARQRLGTPRGTSVFPAPYRPALAATTRLEADRIRRSIDKKGVAAQTFGIYARIRDVDEALRSIAGAQQIVYEIHPEVCFMAWNKGRPIEEPKRKPVGKRLRRDLVEGYFGADALNRVRQTHRPSQVADDDLYDAFAALWTAERISLGKASVIPDPPEVDPLGLRMGIWY